MTTIYWGSIFVGTATVALPLSRCLWLFFVRSPTDDMRSSGASKTPMLLCAASRAPMPGRLTRIHACQRPATEAELTRPKPRPRPLSLMGSRLSNWVGCQRLATEAANQLTTKAAPTPTPHVVFPQPPVELGLTMDVDLCPSQPLPSSWALPAQAPTWHSPPTAGGVGAAPVFATDDDLRLQQLPVNLRSTSCVEKVEKQLRQTDDEDMPALVPRPVTTDTNARTPQGHKGPALLLDPLFHHQMPWRLRSARPPPLPSQKPNSNSCLSRCRSC